jgi:ferredoxin
MNAAAYRRLRIAIGGAVLGFCALAFADIGDWIPAGVAKAALWPQFTPSLLALAHGAGWTAAGAIAVILITLLFGRVYCAMLCPLGVLMDLTAWLARRTGKKRRLSYRPGHIWPRAAAVAVCAAGLLAGSAVPLGLLDPYSIFGKITAATLRPALGWGNHLISSTGVFNPVDVSPVAWGTFGVAAGLLALVVTAAVTRGRLWCNSVCPVGALLGLLSKHARYRLRIADPACVGCSMCERVCPAQCIDFRKHRIDHSRCVMCLDCVTSCKRSGISFHGRELSPKASFDGVERTPRETPTPSHAGPPGERSLPDVSRRTFLTGTLAVPAAVIAPDKVSAAQLTQRNKRAVLPPGARSLAHFQSRCTACHLCVANCPDQVLRPAITEHGLAGFMQPYQDFTVAFCSYNCSNCSQICPTSAIQPLTVEERRAVRTGKAVFFEDRCVVKTKGTSCGACNEHCPTQAVRMVPWKNNLTIPQIDPDLCVGCGGCEFICPVRPDKAIIVDGLLVHERAKLVKLGQQNTVREIEEAFPF